MNLKINLTDEEAAFLKQYAEVYEEERKDDITANPIVVVQNEDCIITQEGYSDRYVWAWDECSYESEEELVDVLKENDYTGEEIAGVLEEIESHGECDLGPSGVVRKFPVIITHKSVAYFLTRKEGERYARYQKHNLNRPRVYSVYTGYDNRGDLACLLGLLRRMGDILNKEDKVDGK